MEIYTGLAGAGLTISFLHAILPNHWLPFVLAGRAQKWSLVKTLWIVTLAGGGHVLITTLLGVGIVWMGLQVAGLVEEWSALLAGSTLILFGAYYVIRHFRGGGGHHHLFGGHHPHGSHDHDHMSHDHDHHDRDHVHHDHGPDSHRHHHHHHDHGDDAHHDHDHAGETGPSHGHDHVHPTHDEDRPGTSGSDVVAVGSLIAMLTFSPCEGFLPVYLTAWPHGWTAFFVLSLVLAVGTLAGMLVFTGLTFYGVRKLSIPALETHEGLILGSILILMGAGVMLLHGHAS